MIRRAPAPRAPDAVDELSELVGEVRSAVARLDATELRVSMLRAALRLGEAGAPAPRRPVSRGW